MGLDELRDEIKETDAKILELMKRRLEIAAEIGKYKIDSGTSLRNTAVEDAVVQRYRDFAENNGFSPDSAELVCRTLIQESVEKQASLIHKNQSNRKIAIIGGAGKMGQWFSGIFASSGNEVTIIDPSTNNGKTIEDAASSDVVIVSVPIYAVDGILKKLDSVCNENALIFDLASLKSPFENTLKEMAKKRKVCSVHPMYGPSAGSMYNRNVIVCDCGNREAVDETVRLLDDRGGNIRVMDISSHDVYMSYVLGLSHAVNIAFFTALERSGISFDDMCTVASTTFKKNMDTNRSVALEDPILYYDIQHLNDHRDEMWNIFSKAVEDIKRASADEDPKAFEELMDLGRKYFEG